MTASTASHTHTLSHTSESRASLQLPRHVAVALPRERQPVWTGAQLAVISEAPVLPPLAVISICSSELTCKTGTNTRRLSTTLGGRDTEMTALSRVSANTH
ncbi:hypothetical protein JOB18_007489 [Solea senegalensis]|uniref:Uncharacterized protein n=1 Tax=Solea senegalensis TaxID=28829 RepID=A0AAV6Q1I0_SOLSE|nr:hypothetical protein JOB18_007489 [Solea senegalensis]